MLSGLCTYVGYNPYYNAGIFEKDTITIHHCAGNLSIKGYELTALTRKNSANYFIDSHGQIAGFIDETDRSWCSSNEANDKRAITIEVANCGGAPDWKVSTEALLALVKLLIDIGTRHPKLAKLRWANDKALIGHPDRQNMTIHQWFSATACPGPYLIEKMGWIAQEVNRRGAEEKFTGEELYRVQVGAFKVRSNAEDFLRTVKVDYPDAFISTIRLEEANK